MQDARVGGPAAGNPFADSSEELGAPESGNHHVHVYFDDDEDTYEIVEAESWDVDDIDASEGEHTLLGGLTTEETARAFLVPEPTVAQRIVRAKRTLAPSGWSSSFRAGRTGQRGCPPCWRSST